MPNRIIKESLCYSEDIDQLSAFEETVFVRLIVNVDDYGRIDARPSFLKSKLFVTKQGITEKNIKDALQKLASVGLVRLYEVDGKSFLLFPKWSSHQRVRDTKAKYPAPVSENDVSPQIAADCGELPLESNPIQSESNPNPNPSIYCAEPPPNGDAPRRNPVITLTLNDKTEYPIFEEQTQEWAALYPAVDVIQQLRNMRGWLDANPARRKTKGGIKKFVNGWLSREQNRGGGSPLSKTTEPEPSKPQYGTIL